MDQDKDIAAAVMLTKGVVTLALVNHVFNMESMQEKKPALREIVGQI